MEWAFAAMVGVIAFLLGYAVRAMKGSGGDSLHLNEPSRMGAARAASRNGDAPPAAPAGQQLASDALAEVEDLLLRGKKIEAIKAYREATGAGLKESKVAVEAIQRKLLNPANSA